MRDRGGLMGSAAARPSGLRKTDKRVIRLTDCLSITPAPGESCPTGCSAFFLNTISSTYTIAAPSQEDWINVLCQVAFQVRSSQTSQGFIYSSLYTVINREITQSVMHTSSNIRLLLTFTKPIMSSFWFIKSWVFFLTLWCKYSQIINITEYLVSFIPQLSNPKVDYGYGQTHIWLLFESTCIAFKEDI